MTREETDFIGGMNMCDEISNEAYKKIMCHCEEQEPCEDAISRQTVMDALCNDCELFRNGEQTCFAKCEEYHFLATLPSVTPQPDTARIIVGKSRGGMTLWHQCEKCNEPIDDQDTFCRGCGRRLVK